MSSALAADVDVGALVLRAADSKLSRRGVHVEPRVTGGTLDRTMDGASTLSLTLDDSDRALLRSGLFEQQIDLKLDDVWWRLVKVTKSTDTLALVFEDRAVALLRQIKTPRKAARSKMTRAEFALSLVREVKTGGGIPFVCPDLHVRQKVTPIASSTQKRSAKQRRESIAPGLAAATPLTVKGKAATSEQKRTAERVLDVAHSLSASSRATLALVEAVIVESLIHNLPGGDADSRGVLQVRDSTAGPMGINNRDVEQCCNAFLSRGFTGRGGAITLAAKHPSWTAGQVAQAVQGSAYPGRYDQARAEATSFIAAYEGVTHAGTAAATKLKALPFQFQRGGTDGASEDSWACLQRLAQEVEWRCFVVNGSCYFVAETTLIRAKPTALLSERTLGVDGIDFDVDNGKANSDATLTVRATRTAFRPGSVVELRECGPANGRWLVASTTRGLFDPVATITLKRRTDPLLEPAPETTTITVRGARAGGAGAVGGASAVTLKGGSEQAARAYLAALAMHAKQYPYVWGGGHAHAGTPDRGTGRDPGIGFDCSGSTCALLAAADMGYTLGRPVDVSGTMARSWGAPGPGQGLTVYANDYHVFVVFHTLKGDQHFGTGQFGKNWGGPGFNPVLHSLLGFHARHWPGT